MILLRAQYGTSIIVLYDSGNVDTSLSYECITRHNMVSLCASMHMNALQGIIWYHYVP